MGRGNRGKKKTKNIEILNLFDDVNKNNNKLDDGFGEFTYSSCASKSKKELEIEKDNTESFLFSTAVTSKNKTNVNKETNYENNDSNYENNEEFDKDSKKLNFFDKDDNELDLYEKRFMVDMFVNKYWNRICVCEPIEDIIIENDNDNDSDDYYNDDF